MFLAYVGMQPKPTPVAEPRRKATETPRGVTTSEAPGRTGGDEASLRSAAVAPQRPPPAAEPAATRGRAPLATVPPQSARLTEGVARGKPPDAAAQPSGTDPNANDDDDLDSTSDTDDNANDDDDEREEHENAFGADNPFARGGSLRTLSGIDIAEKATAEGAKSPSSWQQRAARQRVTTGKKA